MRHILGPWYCISNGDNIAISNTLSSKWANEKHYVGSVTKQNAYLVVAAPDLLESFRQIMDSFGYWMNKYEGPGGVLTSEMYKRAKELIDSLETFENE